MDKYTVCAVVRGATIASFLCGLFTGAVSIFVFQWAVEKRFYWVGIPLFIVVVFIIPNIFSTAYVRSIEKHEVFKE